MWVNCWECVDHGTTLRGRGGGRKALNFKSFWSDTTRQAGSEIKENNPQGPRKPGGTFGAIRIVGQGRERLCNIGSWCGHRISAWGHCSPSVPTLPRGLIIPSALKNMERKWKEIRAGRPSEAGISLSFSLSYLLISLSHTIQTCSLSVCPWCCCWAVKESKQTISRERKEGSDPIRGFIFIQGSIRYGYVFCLPKISHLISWQELKVWEELKVLMWLKMEILRVLNTYKLMQSRGELRYW